MSSRGDSEQVTGLLREASRGDSRSSEQLFEAVYEDLRRVAASFLSSERPDHTLQPTALVHEAYLRLVDQTRVDWQNRSHFLAIAAQAMRRLLVDHARARGRLKRGGDQLRVTLDDQIAEGESAGLEDLVALDQALHRLADSEPEKARLVELRFFGGLSNEEAAEVLDVSQRTVERYWLHARLWLYRELSGGRTTS